MPEDMKKDFEKETGIKVLITYFADNGECISKLRATGGEGYDLAQPSFNQIMDAQKAFNIFQPLDFSKISIMENIIPSLAKGTKAATTINGQQYAIPYTWGTVGAYGKYQKKSIKSPIPLWIFMMINIKAA